MPYKLVIIDSKADKYLLEHKDDYENIDVLFDVESSAFDEYLSGACACVLPFKYNSGASDQSVALRCMRLNKLMISKKTDVMQEYIENGVTGYLLDDMQLELPAVVKKISEDESIIPDMVNKQRNLYIERFSYEAVTSRLKEILESK